MKIIQPREGGHHLYQSFMLRFQIEFNDRKRCVRIYGVSAGLRRISLWDFCMSDYVRTCWWKDMSPPARIKYVSRRIWFKLNCIEMNTSSNMLTCQVRGILVLGKWFGMLGFGVIYLFMPLGAIILYVCVLFDQPIRDMTMILPSKPNGWM